MSKGFKIKGLKSFEKGINSQIKNAQKASKQTSVTFAELFDSGFLSKHSAGKFNKIDEFLNSKFPNVAFKDIPDDKLDVWVKSETDFSSWKELQIEAEKANLASRLGF